MQFNGSFAFFQFLINMLCYSMGISQFFIFHPFSMLLNGKFVFYQFPMLFNGDLRVEKHQGGRYGRTDIRTYGRLIIHPCVLQDIGHLGPLPKKERKKDRRRPTRIELFSSFRLSCIGANRIGIINPLQNPKERKMMKGTQN